jgi:RNA polymerase sigma-70 factor, ECF subfamily
MREPPDPRHVTTLLVDWRRGDSQASERLLSLVYQELRSIAARSLRMERAGHILQPTALVHELYLRLFGGEPVDYVDRTHFFAVAARQLRRILIDHARRVHAEKRGHGHIAVSLAGIDAPANAISEDLIAVNEALDELEKLDPRCAQVVDLRFFAGLTEEEVTHVLGISKATVKRDWDFARAWLHSRLTKG